MKACGIPFQAASRRQTFKEKGTAEILSLLKVLSGCGSYSDFENAAAVVAPRLRKRVIAIFREWCFKNRLCLRDGLSGAARFPIAGLNRKQQVELNGLAARLSAMDRETASEKGNERLLNVIKHPGVAGFIAESKTREALARISFHDGGFRGNR
ncbi:MAG: hypothetical protein MZV70_56380 [Desulfobacterales bacterium]|nr:hypothetical protein [Desulfobacterales bacterium]